MSLYGPTFRVTPVDLFLIFQCNLYIIPYHVLWKYNCFIKLFHVHGLRGVCLMIVRVESECSQEGK